MNRLPKYLWFILGILIGLPLLGYLGWGTALHLQKPRYEGNVKIPGLESSVQVIRDEYGVPHIYSQSTRDAFIALGYVTAQDRLFQMDIVRRLSQGRLSEIIGEDLVPIDKMFRALRLGKWAKEYASSSTLDSPIAWELLDAYLLGVNALIQEGNYPIEYGLMGFSPEEFRREDALSSLAYMGFSFAEGLRSDTLFSILEERMPESRVSDLFPRYDHETGGAILEDQPLLPRLGQIVNPDSSYKSEVNKSSGSRAYESSLLPVRNFSDINSTPAHDLVPFLKGIQNLLSGIPTFEGSNSWLLSGDRTESGYPVLVNDPHIGYSNPGTWFEAHIDSPDLKVYGHFLPGVPFPLLGNTDRMGWGLTMLENDDMDLYRETLSEDESQVLYKNRYVDLIQWEEVIRIKGKSPEKFVVKLTPHGTIFSDFVEGYEGIPISLYWVFHEEKNPLLDVLYGMLVSKNMNEFRDTAGKLAAPGLNISYIDDAGNIAWFGAGRYPIRSKSSNSRKVLDGSSGKDEVQGFLPYSKNPSLVNPKNGIIATANNMSSRREILGIGYLDGYWQPSDRFRRITDILGKKEKYSNEDMKALLLDVYSQSAPQVWDKMIHSIDWESDFWKNVSQNDRDLAYHAWEILSSWNFENHVDSKGATVYSVWSYFAMKNLLHDQVDEEEYKIYTSIADSINSFKALMEKKEHPLWDNIGTPDKIENRDDILTMSLLDTVRYLRENVSSSPNSWQWRNLYHVEYVHAIGRKKPLNLLFNVGPFPTMGNAETVNNVKMYPYRGDFTVNSGPSTRRIVSFENLDENTTILPIGNSGNLASPFYRDQEEMYRKGGFRKTLMTRQVVESKKKYTLELKP